MLKASLVLALVVQSVGARADIPFPVSTDYDAEFAHAADLIEGGERGQAEQVLSGIVASSGQPAWKARVEMLLGADDVRHDRFENAAVHFAAAPASTIGLDPYRRMRLAQALSRQRRREDALREWTRAFESDEPFALRAEAGWQLAALLREMGRPSEALAVLSHSFPASSGQRAAEIGAERIRLAGVLGNRDAIRNAARDLIDAGIDLEAPPAARRALAEELARATPDQRARFGRARLAAGDFRRGLAVLRLDPPQRWSAAERAENQLAIARGFERSKNSREAERAAAAVPADGTEAAFQARLLRCDLVLARLKKNNKDIVSRSPQDPGVAAVGNGLAALTAPEIPLPVRTAAREQLIRMAGEQNRFDDGLAQARLLAAEAPETTAGFEPLWHAAWNTYFDGQFASARAQFQDLAAIYKSVSAQRRLSYWIARCLQREGDAEGSKRIYQDLAAADPADLYGLFARRRCGAYEARRSAPVADPTTAAATYRRTDELLRLRFFAEAAAEASALPSSPGRDRRLAEADFALGRFPAAAAAAKRAFPVIGTAEEGGVPDPWRRLYYPIEVGGYLTDRAKEFGIDAAILRGLVRQESVFEADARSRAGALGLTQLMPATARSLSRSVLRQRYKKAFLYDPKVNARLGAAYFKSLLDEFGNTAYALAAYNGGPGRMARVLHENPNRQEDEIFESHPAYETRDYVRRVLLFAESYRELYGEVKK
jgi:soluble lytic murein transglycosylase-like protein